MSPIEDINQALIKACGFRYVASQPSMLFRRNTNVEIRQTEDTSVTVEFRVNGTPMVLATMVYDELSAERISLIAGALENT